MCPRGALGPPGPTTATAQAVLAPGFALRPSLTSTTIKLPYTDGETHNGGRLGKCWRGVGPSTAIRVMAATGVRPPNRCLLMPVWHRPVVQAVVPYARAISLLPAGSRYVGWLDRAGQAPGEAARVREEAVREPPARHGHPTSLGGSMCERRQVCTSGLLLLALKKRRNILF